MMNLACLIFSFIVSIGYTGGFEEGDWVTYTNFRYVTSVAMDQTTVYFGTTGGVIRFDKFTKEWLNPLTITDGIPDSRIENIAYDPDWNRIWVSTRMGNAYYDPTLQRWYSGGEFPEGLARNDYHPRDYGILNMEFGYFYQDGYLTDRNFQKYQLTRGEADDFDNLYVGTWGWGPVLINTRYKDLEMIPFGPYGENITRIVSIGDEFWLGDGGGDLTSGALSMFDLRDGVWRWFQPRYTDGLGTAKLTDGWGDKKNVWLGTNYGLVRYDKNNNSFRTYADNTSLPSVNVLSVAVGPKYVFTGTNNGIGYIEKAKKKKRSKNKKSSDLSMKKNSVSEKPSPDAQRDRFIGWRIYDLKLIGDYLYMASDHGALRKKLDESSRFEYINTEDDLLSTDIYDIIGLRDSLYLLALHDVVIINTKTEESSIITDPSYFPDWRLRKIATDGVNLWAATEIGLWKYRLKDGYARMFTAGDGMVSDDVRDIYLDGDYIWLATPLGLIRFYWNDSGRVD